MFHCQHSKDKSAEHVGEMFSYSATAKQHATITLIETPEMGQQPWRHTTTRTAWFTEFPYNSETRLPLTFYVRFVSYDIPFVWAVLGVSLRHPRSLQFSGKKDRRHIRDTQLLWLQRRLGIFLVSLWIACTLKASLLKRTSTIAFQKLSPFDKYFAINATLALSPFLHHIHSHFLPPSKHFHCVSWFNKNLCVFSRYSECYWKKKKTAHCIAYAGRDVQ